MTRCRAVLGRVAARVHWEARRGWALLSWQNFAALAALGFWIGLTFAVNTPLKNDLQSLRSQLATAPPTVDAPSAAVPAAAEQKARSAGKIDAFLEFLPPSNLREQQLHTLHGMVAASGMKFVALAYGQSKPEKLPVRRLTLELSATGDYEAHRKLVRDLLIALPNLAIDRIATASSSTQPGRLDVKLESSLYYRALDATAHR